MAADSDLSVLSDLSILISCYNKQSFISSFSRDIQAFIDAGAEVIIVDDGSTDESSDLLEKTSFGSGIIKSENKGVAHARNLALSLAVRKYVIFLDIDDSLNIYAVAAGVEKIKQQESDLLVSEYVRIQDGYVDKFPVSLIPQNGEELHPNSRTLMFQCMGFWRYIYSRNFLVSHDLFFFPTFEQMDGQFFILDDLFWMLHLLGVKKVTLSSNTSDIPMYNYFYELNQPKEKWENFQNQIVILPEAFLVLENVLLNCNHIHDLEWVKATSKETLRRHLSYLTLNKFPSSVQNLIKLMRKSELLFLDLPKQEFLFLVFKFFINSSRNSLSIAIRGRLSRIKELIRFARPEVEQ